MSEETRENVTEATEIETETSSELISEAVSSENVEVTKPAVARWYVIHTYSGYENKVMENLKSTVANSQDKLGELIQDIRIPTEKVTEVRNGKRREIERKLFPGYVLVKMVHTEHTWYIVRNTRGVTGFVGPDSELVPLSEEEVQYLLDHETKETDIAVGEQVRILAGPMANQIGKVCDIEPSLGRVTVEITMFNRIQTIELAYDEVLIVQ